MPKLKTRKKHRGGSIPKTPTSKSRSKKSSSKNVNKHVGLGNQGHGSLIEDMVKLKVCKDDKYNRQACVSKTHKYDVMAENNEYELVNLGIKSSKNTRKSVDFASMLNIVDSINSGEPFKQIVIKYEQRGPLKVPVEMFTINMSLENKRFFLGDLDMEYIKSKIGEILMAARLGVVNRKEYLRLKKELTDEMLSSGAHPGLVIRAAPKVHTNSAETRIQCAMRNPMSAFMEHPELFDKTTYNFSNDIAPIESGLRYSENVNL